MVEAVANGRDGAVTDAEVARGEDPVEPGLAGEGTTGDPDDGVAGCGPEVKNEAVGVDPGEEDQG